MERAFAAAWLLLGVGLTYAGHDLGIGATRDPGTGAFLFWPGLFIAVLAGALIVRPAGNDRTFADLRSAFPLAVVVALIASIAYAAVLETLGFLLATAIFLTITSRLVQARPLWQSAAFGIGAAIAIDVVGRSLLGMPLPAGPLG